MRFNFYLRQARAAARFSETSVRHRHGAPRLGEHTREVLEAAGLTAAELDALAAEAVIGVDELETQQGLGP